MSNKMKMTKKEFTDIIYSFIVISGKDLFNEINKNSLKYNIESKIGDNKIINFRISDDRTSFSTTGFLLGIVKDKEFLWSRSVIEFLKEQFIVFTKDIKLGKNATDIIKKLFEDDVLKLTEKYLLIIPYLITTMFAYSDINVIEFESEIDNKTIKSYMIIKDFPIKVDKKYIKKSDEGLSLMLLTDDVAEISRNKKNLNKKIKKSLLKRASKNISKKFIDTKNIKKYKRVK